MKLDYDCVRDILLFLEKQENIVVDEDGDLVWCDTSLDEISNGLPDYDKPAIYYALHNMEQAGLIDSTYHFGDDVLQMYLVNYITFTGHEFLESVRQDKRWGMVKDVAGKAGNLSLSVLGEIAKDLALQAAKLLIS